MTNGKKIAILVIAVLLITLIVASYIDNRERTVSQPIVDLDKFSYANQLRFGFRLVNVNLDRIFNDYGNVQWVISPGTDRFNPFYTELVFVRSRAESRDFPDNVIVAWPSVGGGEAAIEYLQQAVDRTEYDLSEIGYRRTVITLEEFGLMYPLTVDDLIDNWEKVNVLFQALCENERASLFHVIGASTDLDAEGLRVGRCNSRICWYDGGCGSPSWQSCKSTIDIGQ